MGRRAVLYTRIAAEDPVALAQQRVQLRDYAQAHDYQVALDECDIGSGLSRERSGLQRILAAAEAGEFDVLLTRDLSRLYRDMALFLECYNHLRGDCGVDVVFVRYAVSQEGGDA